MLAPRGPVAASVAELWWVMFWGALVVLALVMVLALVALRRPRAVNANRLIAGGGIVFPVVVLTPLLLYGLEVGAPLGGDAGRAPLEITVVGHRWWWEVRYAEYPDAVTANEIHIPVGRNIRITVQSADVIHSLWVPRLGGKLDLIPGHSNTLVLRADEAGAYRGQCAEFCGAQHAHMALWVIAQPPDQFASWLDRQRLPIAEPTDPLQRRGRARFLSQRCVKCHTVRGTIATGDKGPDLTHVGGRRTIAAGTLDNSRGSIAQWILSNQSIKPGNRMDNFEHLEPEVAREIAAWLESLK